MKKRETFPEMAPPYYNQSNDPKLTKKTPKLQSVAESILKYADEVAELTATAESIERRLLGHNALPLMACSGGDKKTEPNVPCFLDNLEIILASLQSSTSRLNTVLNHIGTELD